MGNERFIMIPFTPPGYGGLPGGGDFYPNHYNFGTI